MPPFSEDNSADSSKVLAPLQQTARRYNPKNIKRYSNQHDNLKCPNKVSLLSKIP